MLDPPSPTSRLRDLRERAQYHIDNVFAEGPLAQFGLLVGLSCLVVLLGMGAWFVGLFSPENEGVEGIAREHGGGLTDTLWWSLKHIFDPAFFDMDYGATAPVLLISFAVSIMGMVLFGILVGFVSSGIEARLELLRRGNSPVKEQGHILILGWSNKVGAIVRMLATYRQDLKVVLLSPHDTETIREALRLEGIFQLPIRVILRSGDPSSIAELHRVAFDRAFSIIVLASSSDGAGDNDPDIEAIRALLLLAAFDGWVGPKPKIVAEVSQKEKREIAVIAGRRRIPVVCSSEIISKLIVQCSRQAGLSAVYSELFAFFGNEIYVRDVPACAGMRFGDAVHTFPGAVLIGVSRAVGHDGHLHFEPALAPGADTIIQSGEWLIFIAAGDRIVHDPGLAAPALAPAPGDSEPARNPERILLLGWNGNVHDILAEYDAYMKPGTRIDLVSTYDRDQALAELALFGHRGYRSIDVTFVSVTAFTRSVIEALGPQNYDCVVLLADESFGESDRDGRTILTQILLEDLTAGAHRPRMLAEILTARSRDLLRHSVLDDIIVSPEIVSMQLAQISQQQMLMEVYDDLLSPGGVEIYLKPMQRYVRLDVETGFADLVAAALAQGEIAIGISLGGKGDGGGRRVQLNPKRDSRWCPRDGDRLIVIAEDLAD